MLKNKTKIISLLFIILSIIIALIGLLFIFSSDVDVSLIKGVPSSVTKLYYFDYESREARLGQAKELADEEIFLHKYEWVSIYDMPKYLRDAFVAIEDKRFYKHKGVDFLRTGKAVINYIFGKDKNSFGGSTITQQLVKNLTGENESTAKRKIKEIVRALKLENQISKNEILELYLNVVYLSENCYGVRAGAKRYFNKNINELTLAESAMLASIVKNPQKYNPSINYENNVKRRNVILKEMHNQGMISDVEYNNASNEETKINETSSSNGSSVFSWFTEALINEVATDLSNKYNISIQSARRKILTGGYNIYTTIDPKIQSNIESVYRNYQAYILPENGKYPNSACVIIDPKTSDILGIVGDIGNKGSNLIFNRATNAKRPPGSVIKPLSVYAPALEENIITYSTVYDDTPVKYDGKEPWPKNSPNKYRGLVPINYAVSHSINTVAVKVLKKLGINASTEFLKKLKINIDEKYDKNESSLALGQLTNGESLLNLTNAYTVFANGGTISKPKTYLYVTDYHGNVILENKDEKERVISPQTAYIMTKMLENVVNNGTGKTAKIDNLSVAGKTGTSSNNEDRWFIGYTPEYVCGIWTGYDTPKPVNSIKNPSCLLFKGIFERIYNDSYSSNFISPGLIIEKEYCFDSGTIPSDICDNDIRGIRTQIGYYKTGTEPKNKCSLHKEAIIDYYYGEITNKSSIFNRKISLVDYERLKNANIKILDEPYLLNNKYK